MGILSFVSNFNKNLKIRYKLILLISGVLLISIIPLSLIILNRSQDIVLKMTYQICTNLGQNLSNLATEELLINETYDTTKNSISKLKQSDINGLLDSYVINIDGKYVADLNDKKSGSPVPDYELQYFKNLTKLEMSELRPKGANLTILRFSYPIFIDYKGSNMRVGAAIFEFDKEKVYESVKKIRLTIIVVSSILFTLGIIIAAYSAIFLSRPIQTLTDGAKQIGDGDLSFRIKLQGKDELGQLASTFNQMTAQIQDFTQNLEDKVAQRTEELNKTLQEVQALKIAQDGDYYLTSLLLTPLQPNNNYCTNIKTEFFIEQKKKFTFRKWNSQIGGDICITDTIKLNGKEYTAFVNGDAMGKSIQGAGGALVLGVVFNAGLMRSKVERYQNVFPESWIKERFLDLQNVFMSFEGSMYISVCMGIIENVSGVMYYINAEHPWTVLYRDGKASFLEDELAIRKLGTPGQEEKFYVRMFPLMSGDVVITGSDGRDDLMIKNEDGLEVVQEDENEFLRRVEEGDGQIQKIVERIYSSGKIIDDISLLRIGFKEDFKEIENDPNTVPAEVAHSVKEGMTLVEMGKIEEAYQKVEYVMKEYQNFPDLLKLLGKLYYHQNDFPKAIECFEQYLEINPSDNEYLYALSNTYRVFGKYNNAADVGERLFLRDQKHLLNLINLATIYLELKVLGRASMMIEKAYAIGPEDENVISLRAQIEHAKSTKSESSFNMDLHQIEEIFNQAETFYKNKNYDRALKLFEDILDTNKFKNSPRILLKIANCYTHMGELEKAIIFYNRTISEDELNFHAHNNLGGIYFKQGFYNRAREEWKKALEIKTDFKPAAVNLERLEKFTETKLIKGS
jgi:tetratricopeptide (TPR) repeat protein/HAMP domain-containing protein